MYKVISHIPYFLPLFGILAIGLFGFYTFSYDHTFQVGVIIAVGMAHVVWGVVFHAIHKDLTVKVFLEYVIIALLGVSSVLAVLG